LPVQDSCGPRHSACQPTLLAKEQKQLITIPLQSGQELYGVVLAGMVIPNAFRELTRQFSRAFYDSVLQNNPRANPRAITVGSKFSFLYIFELIKFKKIYLNQ